MRHFLVDSKLLGHDRSQEEPINTPTEPFCHHCSGREFRVGIIWRIMILHFQVNPGLVVNETIFGQRVPKTTFCAKCPGICQQYAQCPGCSRFHHAKIWDKCAFGNWAGVACPDCGESMPCHHNILTHLVLFVLLPFRWAINALVGDHFKEQARQRSILSRKHYYAPLVAAENPEVV